MIIITTYFQISQFSTHAPSRIGIYCHRHQFMSEFFKIFSLGT
jgi:hypothetical protein